ncbi:MAG: baseplate assembly protein [Beijerinckiaceae bacterium]|nr:baseplate assembly protein [Beijerinckiaceae bacterium]
MFNADEFGELIKVTVDLSREVAQLKRELAGMVKVGRVAETDAQKGYRLDFGNDDNGQPKLSPWLPHPEAGGKAKSWFPLSPGQVVAMMTPPGDPRQGFLLRDGFTDQYKQPSENLQENVFEFGNARVVIKDDHASITVGSASITIANGVITLKASQIKHERA